MDRLPVKPTKIPRPNVNGTLWEVTYKDCVKPNERVFFGYYALESKARKVASALKGGDYREVLA